MPSEFRPCIDLHQGKVKQIVGSSFSLTNTQTNFESNFPSSYFAEMYKTSGLKGGHVIQLGKGNQSSCLEAIKTYPLGLQVGGGINNDNAHFFLDAGASHVIVTSWLFPQTELDKKRLELISHLVGKDRLVIDLSCQKNYKGEWVVMKDQWQTETSFVLNASNIKYLEKFCDELLIHATHVEGLKKGIAQELVANLSEWTTIPTTYAGGVRHLADLELVRTISGNKIHVTVGSALDIFGGNGITYQECLEFSG